MTRTPFGTRKGWIGYVIPGPCLVPDTVYDVLEHCVRNPKVLHEVQVQFHVDRVILKFPQKF